MIVLVGGNKGGCGKTTTCCNLAVRFAMEGKEVCIVDADRQGSAARWNLERESSGVTPAITLVQKYDNLTQTLKSLSDKYDVILVDVAGRNSREMITAATIADLIIAPHQCSQLDLDTLEELQGQADRILDLNPELKILIYQTMASTNVNVIDTERNDFEEYVGEFSQFRALKSVCRYRKVYRDVMSEGQSVLESTNQSASDEVNDLFNEVFANG